MLHTFVRSENHIKRLLKGDFAIKKCLIVSSRGVFKANIIKIENLKGKKTDIFITQNFRRTSHFYPDNYSSEDIQTLSCEGISFSALITIKDFNKLLDSTIAILDEDIYEKYDIFLKNNKKSVDPLRSKISLGPDALHLLIFSYTSTAPNLFAWALKVYYENGCRLNVLQHIFHFTKKYPQNVGKVKKGTITAYGNDWLKLRYEINDLILLKRANTVVNSFNTAQKKLLKTIELTNEIVILLNKFYRLSKQKKINFIQRMSNIDDIDDILRQMEVLTNKHFEWNRDSLLDFLKNNEYCDYEIVFDNNSDLLVIKTLGYETVKYLAKATNWCIAKNKKYWNQYNNCEEEGKISQYIIFDFSVQEDSKYSIIGVTVNNTLRITAAHNFNNDNMLVRRNKTDFISISSFLPKLSNIYGYLEYKKIPLDVFGNGGKIEIINWSQDIFFKSLEEKGINYDDIDIRYTNENGVVVLIINAVETRTVEKIYGRDNTHYIFEHLPHRLGHNCKMLIMCDFSKPYNSSARMYTAFVEEDKQSFKDTNYGVLFDANLSPIDASIERFFEIYNIPFDVIKHPNDDLSKFVAAISNYNFNAIKYFLEEKNMLAELKRDTIEVREIKNEIKYKLSISIFEYFSLDFLNFIYDNGYKVRELLDISSVILLLEDIYSIFIGNYDGRYDITESMFENVLRGNVRNYNNHKIMAIVSYFTFKRILEEEESSELGSELFNRFNRFASNSKLFNEMIFFHMVNTYDINTCKMPNIIQKFVNVSVNMMGTSKSIEKFMNDNYNEYLNIFKLELAKSSF